MWLKFSNIATRKVSQNALQNFEDVAVRYLQTFQKFVKFVNSQGVLKMQFFYPKKPHNFRFRTFSFRQLLAKRVF